MGQYTPFGIKTNEPSVKTAEFNAAKKLSLIGTTLPRYCLTSAGYFSIASLIEQNITPSSANFSLKVVAMETLSNTASTATFESLFCSFKGIPSLVKVFNISGSTSSRLFFCSIFFGANPNPGLILLILFLEFL